MNGVILTWRWQNILSIWIMTAILAFLVIAAVQIKNRVGGNAD